MVKAEESPARTRNVFAVLGIVFGILFLIATIGTVVSLVGVNDLLTNATHVDGRVVNMIYDSKGRRAPVVRFETANGAILQLKSALYTAPAPNVGDPVKVVYRSSNPQDWQIDDWFHLYFWTLMGSIFMFAWAMAMTTTTLVGQYQLRKVEQARAGNGQTRRTD